MRHNPTGRNDDPVTFKFQTIDEPTFWIGMAIMFLVIVLGLGLMPLWY